jgi:hypothetical protein
LSDPLRDPAQRVLPTSLREIPISAEYEYRMFTLPRGTGRSEARKLLTDHAEYGRWELDRVQTTWGGGRRILLRRRIMRVERTL